LHKTKKIAGLNFFKIRPKRQETCGNCNSLQDKELAEQNESFTVKRRKMHTKMKRHAEMAFLGFVIPYIIRNYAFFL